MKYNYPVKYCAMPVEANDWFGNKIEIKAFIVSKCYVINKIIKILIIIIIKKLKIAKN